MISAPFVWFLLPILLAIGYFFIWHDKTVHILCGWTSLILASLAVVLPPNSPIDIPGGNFILSPEFRFFERTFSLARSDQGILLLVYLFGAIMFFTASILDLPKRNSVIQLAVLGIMVGSISVDPFLYSAILIEFASLILVPTMTSSRGELARGALRFIANQSLGMPFILLAGFLLTGVEAGPNDLTIVLQAMLMLALGFSFLLSIFPFYAWATMLAKQIPPHSLVFITFVMPFFAILLGLDFIEKYSWLRESNTLFEMIRIVSLITISSAAVWMAFEKNLGKTTALAVLLSTGLALLSISTEVKQLVLPLFFNISFANIIFVGLISTCSTLLYQKTDSLELATLAGAGRKFPFLTSGIVVAILAISGVPLFGNSTAIITIFGFGNGDWSQFLLVMVCGGFVLFSAYRIFRILFSTEQYMEISPSETKVEKLFVSTSIAILIVLNLIPNLLPISLFQIQEAMPNFLR